MDGQSHGSAMHHFTRQTCLEAAIGDLMRQSENDQDGEQALESSVTGPAYFDMNFSTDLSHSYQSYGRSPLPRAKTTPHDEAEGSLDPRFPAPDFLWHSVDQQPSSVNETLLYETLYTNLKWNSTPQSCSDRQNLDQPLSVSCWPASMSYQSRAEHNAPEMSYSNTASTSPNATDCVVACTGYPMHAEFGYCRSDRGDQQHDELTATHLQGHEQVRASSGRPPTRKQHQRVQDKIRTRALNTAFGHLRSCLPEIPKDTKLTKIRTLRTAITYIRQLMNVLDTRGDTSRVPVQTRHSGRTELTNTSPSENSVLRDSGYDSMFERC